MMESNNTEVNGKQVVIKTYLGEFEAERLDPIPDGNKLIGTKCFFCRDGLKAGDETCLIPTRPATQTDQDNMYTGRPYTCLVELAHWSCLVRFAVELVHKGVENDQSMDCK